ncbi:hypothetical protein [Ferrimonas aestuarii]|uniref:Uncharacterized protein n=1 Tax=Ferrimonas aestuarii TaxID=2569539 RepID=A0A4U1BKJ8_9GAMM|nr:hypothetical protein [Ferrimonas aestuarii]TKB52736.1 hypothetical protein FCL42_15620 [Ferrimonas aestuarii]
MNVIVPIHVEALRVAPSSNQTAKTALYDFAQLGQQPASSLGGLIASNRFATAQTSLNSEPGIHLHWTLPRSYTRGVQDEASGDVRYPVMPNRWLIIRFFKNKAGNSHIRLWVMESDSHTNQTPDKVKTPTAIPWMDNPNALQGVQGNYLGKTIDLSTGSWSEPTDLLKALSASGGQNGYLGEMFQATYGYGETFTAFYPNCNQVLGIWDTLDDCFDNPETELELNTDFSVSYGVMGWVSDLSTDECNIIVNQALDAYNNMGDDKPDFSDYLQDIFEQNLGWSLSSFDGITPDNAGKIQAVASGILSDIEWKIKSPGNPSYPTAAPSADKVQVAIGNNTAEALSAYLSSVEAGNAALDNGEGVDSNIEWLLNALQYNQLHGLAAGEQGVGQLESFLHGTAFADVPGGYQWGVKQKHDANPTSGSSADNEVPLPDYLSKVLAQLNDKQHSLDAVRDDINGRRKQIFFDWVHHVTAINDHVLNNPNALSNDNTGAFMVDGLFQLFPRFLQAGNYSEAGQESSPFSPECDSFQIEVPDSFPSDGGKKLATYTFNASPNGAGTAVVNPLLELGFGLDQAVGEAFPTAVSSLQTAQRLLRQAKVGGSDAGQNILSAQGLVKDAATVMAMAHTSMTALSNTKSGLLAQAKVLQDAQSNLTQYVEPSSGVFAKDLPYTPDPGKAPLPAGQSYTGAIGLNTLGNLKSWEATDSGFIGIKALMDRLSGQGGNAASPVNTSAAALYLGYAYFYANSNLVFKTSSAYYLQLCEYEINQAIAAASTGSAALGSALTTLGSSTLKTFSSQLATISEQILPAVLNDLTQTQPDLDAALNDIDDLLASADAQAPSITALQQMARDPDWQSLRNSIGEALETVAGRLADAQQVTLWNGFLGSKVSSLFELTATPADYYKEPTEPVILLAQSKVGDGDDNDNPLSDLVRNGKAAVIPCRLNAEIVTPSQPVTYPAPLSQLSTNLNTKIPGLSQTLQSLAQELYLLTPELSSTVTEADLEQAAADNQQLHYNALHNVTLSSAPQGLKGKLPYYTAYNWRQNRDPFLPLFIWWNADYRFSDQFDTATQSYPSDFLDQFELGQYEVELQPSSSAINNFKPGTSTNNSFPVHGLISLSSAATTSLCDQISTYCSHYLNYDPQQGAPVSGTENYDEKLKFYQAYSDYKTRNILSQGLSGFNPGIVTREQELQIPINIPQNWTSQDPKTGFGLALQNLWPTSLLHGQSLDWPIEWNDEGPNPDAFAGGNTKAYFNPLRAGFLKLTDIVLVDAFGRSVTLPKPNPTAVAETMTSAQTPPDQQGHNTYLAPRLAQPSRVNFNWRAAESTSGISSYLEDGDHPAASPICGWLWPNHLDDSLMLYDAAGRPMGSLGTRETKLHWFPVPGETTEKGANNRDQMQAYFAAKQANSVFVDFVCDYLYADSTSVIDTRFQQFLEVTRKAQQFIVTPEMQQSASLGVLMGEPLVITQASISITQKGAPFVGLNDRTYPKWDQSGPQFAINANEYIPYNFGNFNEGNLSNLDIRCRIGMAEIQTPNGANIPYFNDGVAGYFLGEDWGTLYTPVAMNNSNGITSVAAAGTSPLNLKPNGSEAMLTLVMNPRAAVHATTGVLPMKPLSIPPELFADVLQKLQITFLTAPLLRAQTPPAIPLPAEAGYDWSWVEIGAPDLPLQPAQGVTNAVFPQKPQMLVDGWLKLNNAKQTQG